MIRLTEEPQDSQWYWWLPKFLIDKPDNPSNWSIVFCGPGRIVGREGVFIGPLKAPIHENQA